MKKSTFLFLSLAGFFAITSSTMSKSPTLPLFAESLGLSSSEIGFVAAASTITGIFVNFIAGTFSDIYGRKKMLTASGIFFATAPFTYLLVDNGLSLTLVRIYHGIATATFTPVSLATIADIYREKRGEMMGTFSSVTMVGRLLAPTMAGLLITFSGFYEVYMVCGAIGIASLLSLTTMPPPETTFLNERNEKNLRFQSVLFNTRILLLGLINATIYFSMQGLETFLPLYMEALSIETWKIGALFTLQLFLIAISKPYMGRLSDKLGRRSLIIVGMTISSITLLTLIISKNYCFILLSILTLALGVSLSTASLTPLASEVVSTETYGTAMGTLETIKDIGQALGPIITGIIVSSFNFTKAFLVMAVVTILITTLFTATFK